MSNTQKTKKKKKYWDKTQEDAVKEYLSSSDKNSIPSQRLFSTVIYPGIRKIVESILFTYQLATSNELINDQIDECVSFIITKLHKFDPDRGTKAFSYFGTIAKNYFILRKNRQQSQLASLVTLDDIHGTDVDIELAVENEVEEELQSQRYYIDILSEEFERELESDLSLSAEAIVVGEAIVYVMKTYDKVNVYSKNLFFWIAREMTGLPTKKISKALKELMPLYQQAKTTIEIG
ncbi:MAG: hypothetical protein ACFFG0_18945 [Candidatus Thorarchaeota archaeon]